MVDDRAPEIPSVRMPQDDLTKPGLDIPFIDLAPSHRDVKHAILAELADLIDDGGFTNGPQVRRFEDEYARYCGTRHCVGMSSGLDGLRLALLGMGLLPGDEVIVPASTFIATFEAVTQAGGVPIPVDVSPGDRTLDASLIEASITDRSRVLLPVHLYGQMADMRHINEVAHRYGLSILEDACQAHGASRAGIRPGELATAAVFSFYPAKNLGAFGDAGAVCTNNELLDEQLRARREHGQRLKYRHDIEGYTARLDTIQALVLLHKLPHLDAWNEQRRNAARFYLEALSDVHGIDLPYPPKGSNPAWHVFAVEVDDPVALGDFLRAKGISTGRHYPEPPHLSAAYAHLGFGRGTFPITERIARRTLSLPLFPGILADQLETVVDAVSAYWRSPKLPDSG